MTKRSQEVNCDRCGGKGTVTLGKQDVTCPRCKGKGTILRSY